MDFEKLMVQYQKVESSVHFDATELSSLLRRFNGFVKFCPAPSPLCSLKNLVNHLSLLIKVTPVLVFLKNESHHQERPCVLPIGIRDLGLGRRDLLPWQVTDDAK
jgi:hypothetical protein